MSSFFKWTNEFKINFGLSLLRISVKIKNNLIYFKYYFHNKCNLKYKGVFYLIVLFVLV